MKIKDLGDTLPSSDFWYDLFEGGYIKPEKYIANKKDLSKVRLAMAVLEEFKASMENASVLEEM